MLTLAFIGKARGLVQMLHGPICQASRPGCSDVRAFALPAHAQMQGVDRGRTAFMGRLALFWVGLGLAHGLLLAGQGQGFAGHVRGVGSAELLRVCAPAFGHFRDKLLASRN